jgi:phosphoadenosine phosphosulfate reductase
MHNLALLNSKAAHLTLTERMHLIADKTKTRIVFTTSFGIEDQAITHAIHAADVHNIEFLTLDTGRLFNETYDVWTATEEKYGFKIKAFNPKSEATEAFIAQSGINGFYNSIEARKACCAIRKVEPLTRALNGADVWITGLRGDQSDARTKVQFAEFDTSRNLIKFNPLFDWSREKVASFTADNNVPVNALHYTGFVSIGCAPCTRAINAGELERAGRWWWEDEAAKECGLHVNPEGKLVRIVKEPVPEVFR